MSGHARLAARLGDVIGGHGDAADGDVSVDIAAGVAVGFAVFVVGALAIAVAPLTIAGTIVAVTVAGGTALGAGGFMTALLAGGQLTALEEGSANKEGHLGGAPCGNVVGICSSNVYIENKLVARARSDHGAHDVSPVLQGSATVHVNGLPLAREGDAVACGGKLIVGAEHTWIGGPKEGPGSRAEQALAHLARVSRNVSMAGVMAAIGAPIVAAGVTAAVAAAATGGLLSTVGAFAATVAEGSILAARTWVLFDVGMQAAHVIATKLLGEETARYVDLAIVLGTALHGAHGAAHVGAHLSRGGEPAGEAEPPEAGEGAPPDAGPPEMPTAPRAIEELPRIPTVPEIGEARSDPSAAREAAPEKGTPEQQPAEASAPEKTSQTHEVHETEGTGAEETAEEAAAALEQKQEEAAARWMEGELKQTDAKARPEAKEQMNELRQAIAAGEVKVRVVEGLVTYGNFVPPEGAEPPVLTICADTAEAMAETLYHEGTHYQQWAELGRATREEFTAYYKKNYWWMETEAELAGKHAVGRRLTPRQAKMDGGFLRAYEAKPGHAKLDPAYLTSQQVRPNEIPRIPRPNACTTCAATPEAREP